MGEHHDDMVSESLDFDNMLLNPWAVETAEDFHFYCCPECDHRSKTIQKFEIHATEEHPKAKCLFHQTSDIKEEPKPEWIKDENSQSESDFWQPEEEEEEDRPLIAIKKKRKRRIKLSEKATEDNPSEKRTYRHRSFFKCQECNYESKSMFFHARHLKEKHNIGGCGEQQWSCPACNMLFADSEELKQHIRNLHWKRGLCSICNEEKHDIRYHMKTVHSEHREDKPFKCEECTFATHTRMNLVNHVFVKHRKEEHTAKCQDCGKVFPFEHLLKTHVDIKHRGLGQQHVCEVCGRSFAYSNQIKTHVCRPPGVEREKVKCITCGDLFSTDGHYITHHKSAHGGVPQDISSKLKHLCDQCPKIFASKLGLSLHKKRTHEKIEAPKYERRDHICAICGKGYKSQANLTEHERSKHQNYLPFECTKCDKKFGTKVRLRMHLKSVHEREECPECGQKITNSYWLVRHLASTHGIHQEGAIHCDYCPRFFFSILSKDKHIQTHHLNDLETMASTAAAATS
jgi:uncharacterized Zn-finger protein